MRPLVWKQKVRGQRSGREDIPSGNDSKTAVFTQSMIRWWRRLIVFIFCIDQPRDHISRFLIFGCSLSKQNELVSLAVKDKEIALIRSPFSFLRVALCSNLGNLDSFQQFLEWH